MTAVLLVSQIWKKVAEGAPYLWTNIVFGPAATPHDLLVAKQWLTRSKHLLLSVTIERGVRHCFRPFISLLDIPRFNDLTIALDEPQWSEDENASELLLQLQDPFIPHRLRKLSIQSLAHPCDTAFFTSFPALDTLGLDFSLTALTKEYWVALVDRTVAAPRALPNLQKVTLVDVHPTHAQQLILLRDQAGQARLESLQLFLARESAATARKPKWSAWLAKHRCGDIIRKPAVNEAHLCRVPATDWDSMPDVERVKLWGTGMDLFILGKEAGPRTTDIRAQVVRNNAMGTPLQVQVQGLRVVPDDDDDAKADYTEAIRTTTLREVLSHAERSDGLVLNALDLPGGHFIHPNPLLGTGFDLENVAYCQTNGLPGFETKYPKYEEMYWKLLALAHAFSYFHFDICATWVYVSGPGEKFWIRSRPRTTANSHMVSASRDISDPTAFENWQPDHASIQDCDYEVVVLPAGSGILLQQPGREHTVISSNTGSDGRSDFARTATWTVGGYFFCASSIRPAMSVTLHMVMVQHLLTNADHFPMWPIFIRVNMFGLTSLTYINGECPKAELDSLAAYCPDLGDARGWIDIIDLSCMVVLFPALDLRRYGGTGTPEDELSEAEFTSAKYVSWRKWVAGKYRGFGASHKELDWERDIFSPSLLHLAVTLYHYHRRRSNKDSEVEVFRTFTSKAFASAISDALYSYDQKLVKQFQTKIDASEPLGSTHFFLFEDKELYFKAL
ncbi:hypothetical protein B0H14DRAFT_2607824 [Mycena olivaceomarginata]|nr:hypothetical protein B0H14DRAFT_2607824 [Mycena olivaceomarginata]